MRRSNDDDGPNQQVSPPHRFRNQQSGSLMLRIFSLSRAGIHLPQSTLLRSVTCVPFSSFKSRVSGGNHGGKNDGGKGDWRQSSKGGGRKQDDKHSRKSSESRHHSAGRQQRAGDKRIGGDIKKRITSREPARGDSVPRVAASKRVEGDVSSAKAAPIDMKNLPHPTKLNDSHEERLVKRITDSRQLSRRAAAEAIKNGKVKVNGKTALDPSVFVNHDDNIIVDGTLINKSSSLRLWTAYKLRGELITNSDPQGRPTIFQRFEKMGLPKNLICVGRMDFNTEGIILLTNNGDLSRFLEHPTSEIKRVYKAKVRGKLSDSWLKSLKIGARIGGIKYKPDYLGQPRGYLHPPPHLSISINHSTISSPVNAYVERAIGEKSNLVHVECSEGKNHHVKNIFEHMNLYVSSLLRTEYGPYSISNLPRGSVREVRLDNKIRRDFIKSFKTVKGDLIQSRLAKQTGKEASSVHEEDDDEEDSLQKDKDVETEEVNHQSLVPNNMDVASLRRELISRGINIVGGKRDLARALNDCLGISPPAAASTPSSLPPAELPPVTLETINSLRVVDLRELLKERGLKVSGNKDSLIERLRETMK